MGWSYMPDPPQFPQYPTYQPTGSAVKDLEALLKVAKKMEKKETKKKKDEKKEEPFFFLGFKVERMNKKKESKISPAMMVFILMALGPFIGAIEKWAETAIIGH